MGNPGEEIELMERSKLSPRYIAIFAYYWLCLGFFLGSLTLMGPVRWAVTWSRAHGFNEGIEKSFVFALIGLLAVISFLCARFSAAKTPEAGSKIKRFGLMGAAFALLALSLWFWMNPRLMTDQAAAGTPEKVSNIEFVFGPYPDRARMQELKKERYTAVISLLSPAVVPFEPVLIKQEESLAEEMEVELIHIPMLPWISANDQSEARIRELAEKGYGKYYVHCYLGKDRVNVFRRMLAAFSKNASLKTLEPGSRRTLYDIKKFERGEIFILDKDVFFTPYPTDEEFFGYVLNGSVKSLVCLLNPQNKEDLPWIEKEKAAAAKYGLAFVNYPWLTLDAKEREEAVKAALALERPMAIHAFNSYAPECEEFMRTYKRLKTR